MNIHVRMNFKQNDYIPNEHFDEIFTRAYVVYCLEIQKFITKSFDHQGPKI